MGRHAFADPPAHGLAYQAIRTGPLPRLHGVEQRWNIPAVEHSATLGDEADFPGVDHYVLTLQVGGGRTRRVDAPRLDAVAEGGAVSLQQPDSGGRFRSEGPVDYAHLYFRPSLLCEVGDNLGLGDRVEIADFFARRSSTLEDTVRAYLARARDTDDPASRIEMDSRAYLVGVDLLRLVHGALPLVDPAGPSSRRPELGRAIDLVEARYDEPLRLSDMADAVGLSPFHFARLFRAQMGETPAAYLMRRRTERAHALIADTALSLAEIAHRTGFSSQSHMTRRIRQRFGATPRQLRGAG